MIPTMQWTMEDNGGKMGLEKILSTMYLHLNIHTTTNSQDCNVNENYVQGVLH
jgi:hypothetical protein